MNSDEFDALVRRLDSLERRHPRTYRACVAGVAALGYGFVVFVPAATVALLAYLLASAWNDPTHGGWMLLPAAPAAWFLFSSARALWVVLEPPTGLELKRTDAPALFDEVERMRRELRCPRVHHILLTDAMNASLVQHPRLGVFGFPRNYLVLGLTLMMSLSPEHVLAAVGHELGHLSKRHGRFGGWVYRIERTWGRVMEAFQKRRGPGAWAFRRFFQWYSPYFTAYSFVLRRANEFVADRASARVTTPPVAAAALLDIHVRSEHVDEYWNKTYIAGPHASASPPGTDAFVELAASLKAPRPADAIAREARRVLQRKTASTDSHPALAERLQALGFGPTGSADAETPVPPEVMPAAAGLTESGAERFFGPALPSLTDRVVARWRKQVVSAWVARYNRVKHARAELEKLDALAAARTLTPDEAWQRVATARECHGTEKGRPLVEHMLAAHPDHAPANYALGQMMLETDEPAGVERITRAMELDPEAVLPGCELLIGYFTRTGQTDEVRRHRQRYDERVAELRRAQAERALFQPGDRLEPHGWGIEKVQPVVDQLAQLPKVRRAYLVRKSVRNAPELPCYWLVVEASGFHLQVNQGSPPFPRLQRKVAEMQYPEAVQIFVLPRGSTLIFRASEIRDSLIYDRNDRG